MSDTVDRDDPEEPIPETTSLTDPRSQRRARDRIKREAQESASLWRAILNDKIGRREMWRLIQEDCNGFTPPFACGPNGFPNEQATWFQAGLYSLGQRLYQRWLRIAPDSVRLMHEENDSAFIAPREVRQRDRNRGDIEGS